MRRAEGGLSCAGAPIKGIVSDKKSECKQHSDFLRGKSIKLQLKSHQGCGAVVLCLGDGTDNSHIAVRLAYRYGKAVSHFFPQNCFAVPVNESYSYMAVVRSITKAEDDGTAPLMGF